MSTELTYHSYLMRASKILLSFRVKSLTPLEELWYRRALDFGWLYGGMPADPQQFASIIERGCTPEAAAKIISIFYEQHPDDDTKVVNETQECERQKVLQNIRQKSAAGKESARKRKEKQSTDVQQPFNERCNSRSTGEVTIEKNRIEKNRIEKNAEPLGAKAPTTRTVNLFSEEEEVSKKKTSSKKKLQTAEEVIEELEANELFKGIDIRREALNAQRWLTANPGRKFTKRFFVNWLNRVDTPIDTSSLVEGSPAAEPPPPAYTDEQMAEMFARQASTVIPEDKLISLPMIQKGGA